MIDPITNTDFLGAGWSLPSLVHGRRIALSNEEANIGESIWTILATAPGERVMRPDFGCGLHDLVFALPDAATIGKVKEKVKSALVRWEPRISVQSVDVEIKDRGEILLINIHYTVRSTNNFFNMVYPFYLTVGAN